MLSQSIRNSDPRTKAKSALMRASVLDFQRFGQPEQGNVIGRNYYNTEQSQFGPQANIRQGPISVLAEGGDTTATFAENCLEGNWLLCVGSAFNGNVNTSNAATVTDNKASQNYPLLQNPNNNGAGLGTVIALIAYGQINTTGIDLVELAAGTADECQIMFIAWELNRHMTPTTGNFIGVSTQTVSPSGTIAVWAACCGGNGSQDLTSSGGYYLGSSVDAQGIGLAPGTSPSNLGTNAGGTNGLCGVYGGFS